MNKAYKYIFTLPIIIISILCMPFSYSIKANEQATTKPFIGYNFSVTDYDVEYDRVYRITNNETTGTFDTQGVSGNAISMGEGTTTSGAKFYSTGLTGGGIRLKGNITITNNTSLASTLYTRVRRVVQLEILLDSSYYGSFLVEVRNGSTVAYFNYVTCNSDRVAISFADDLEYYDTNTSGGIYNLNISDVNLVENVRYNWSFPIESYNIINSFFLSNFEHVGFNEFNNYTYPKFLVPSNSLIYKTQLINNTMYSYVFIINKQCNTITWFNNLFAFDKTGITIDSLNLINRFIVGDEQYYYVKVNFKQNTGSTMFNVSLNYKYSQEAYIIPIYFGATNNQYVTTDFALLNGLSNQIIDNLNLIANGSTASNNSVNNANQSNQTGQTTFQQEEQFVNNQETAMQQNLENLDISNKNNNLFGNTNFIASAQWVKQQFDFFTTDNAFGYLITFSLVIGLALVIVGKLRS